LNLASFRKNLLSAFVYASSRRWCSRSGWRKAAGIGAAGIGMMRKAGGVADDAAAMEDRREHDDVLEMGG
jgi:hypothetical protein